ncbi:MAG: hypothetical protein COB20_11730 [SAR86 cluster bacterium]|uniref:Peptidase M28 domain-containing protein n=1 Tax=SAR86 cluster bacterium TaxID=2030880 RepID=A0A2A4X1L3_9GAMM|nr:MAG: hypothetical protein COB20_11730 [SAR86 cluster bacterium]
MDRRHFNKLLAATSLAGLSRCAIAQSNDQRQRISAIIREYSAQGDHRTATDVDKLSGQWLADRITQMGVDASLHPFSINQVKVISAQLHWSGGVIEGVPAYDCNYTDGEGLQGSMGELNSGADIGVIMSAARGPVPGSIHAARMSGAHKAIVVVTDDSMPAQGTTVINADDFTDPFGPPVLHIPHYAWSDLKQAVDFGASARVVAHCERAPNTAVNVEARIRGSNSELSPMVIMTPRSGWWRCASERAGGIALFLEMMRAISLSNPQRDVYFTANSGHELGHLGLDQFIHNNPGLVENAHVWIHLGANFAAAGAAIFLQYSSEANRALTHKHLSPYGIQPAAETPISERPRGEARNIYDGSGEFISLLSQNPLFHHPDDTWPNAIDLPATLAWTRAFTALVVEISRQS